MTNDKGRNRWTALAEELTEGAKPVIKPAITVGALPKLNVPRLFQQKVVVVDGIVDPCPNCKCRAFVPVLSAPDKDWYVTCLVCSGSPSFSVDSSIIRTNTYTCQTCKGPTQVTLDEDRINIWCQRRCQRFTLHARFGPKQDLNRNLMVDNAIMLQGLQDLSGFDLEPETPPFAQLDETMNYGPDEMKVIEDFALGVRVRADDVSPFIFQANQKKVRRRDDQPDRFRRRTFPAPPSSRPPPLFDMTARADAIYKLLALKPYDAFFNERYQENCVAGLKDPRRRTGRTTRALVEALALVFAHSAKFLWIRASNVSHTRELIRRAWEFYFQLTARAAEPLVTVGMFSKSGGSAEEDKLAIEKSWECSSFFEGPREAVFLTDHHWYELELEQRGRARNPDR